MSFNVALIAIFLMCQVLPATSIKVKSVWEIDFNVFYMLCGEAKSLFQPPAFQNYSIASALPACQLKFVPFSDKYKWDYKSADPVFHWKSLSNDSYHFYEETVFVSHPEIDPRLTEKLDVCYCTESILPYEDLGPLLHFSGWALISPFYQPGFISVYREEKIFSRFMSEYEKQANTSLNEHVVIESVPNYANTSIVHLFSFRHHFVETLQISDTFINMFFKLEPDLVLFETIKYAIKNHNLAKNWENRLMVVNQTKVFNVTKSIVIPSDKKATVTHRIQYLCIDIALNETTWYAIGNFTFQGTVHILPPQLVYRVLQQHFYGEETYFEGNTVVIYKTFIAKGTFVTKVTSDFYFRPINNKVKTRKIYLFIIAGTAGVVSLMLVGYLRFRKVSKKVKHISRPLIPFGVIHVPGYSTNNDSNNNDSTDDPNVINTSHPHYQDLLTEIFHDSYNVSGNDSTNNINTDTAHALNNDPIDHHNDISDEDNCANKSNNEVNDSSDDAKSNSDANSKDSSNDNNSSNDNADSNGGKENDINHPPPNYQEVLAETYDVLRTPGIPAKGNIVNEIELVDCDEHIYAEIYDVPRIPSIPVRRA